MAESREEKIARAMGGIYEPEIHNKGATIFRAACWKFPDGSVVWKYEMENFLSKLETQARIRQRVRELWCDDSAYICVYHLNEESFSIELWDGRACLFMVKHRDTEAEAWEEALFWLVDRKGEKEK